MTLPRAHSLMPHEYLRSLHQPFVLSIEDIFNNPQYQARENILEVEHPRLGSVKVPGIVPKFSATPGRIRHRAPELGEHNEEILKNEIGLTEEQIEQLYEKGVI